MEFETIQSAITTLGFPIVLVIVLMYFIKSILDKQQVLNEKREDKLYEVLTNAQSVNRDLSNTNAEFVHLLESYKSDLDEIKTDIVTIKNKL